MMMVVVVVVVDDLGPTPVRPGGVSPPGAPTVNCRGCAC